jgi:hypothetical protein
VGNDSAFARIELGGHFDGGDEVVRSPTDHRQDPDILEREVGDDLMDAPRL